MPTYDYKCEKCGHFEVVQPITAQALTTCPTCNGAVKRLISRNVNIVFKGSGFHITDYRSDSYKSKVKAETSSGSGNGTAGSSTGSKESSKDGGKSDAGAKNMAEVSSSSSS